MKNIQEKIKNIKKIEQIKTNEDGTTSYMIEGEKEIEGEKNTILRSGGKKT